MGLFAIHSTTKYLGGHSDIIGGAVVGSREHIENIFHRKVHLEVVLTHIIAIY